MARLAIPVVVLMCGTIACSTFARSQSLDLQEKCALQARKTFEELEKEDKDSLRSSPNLLGTKTLGGNYQSHYNTKLKRCLVLIRRSDDFSEIREISTTWFLVDANERRSYATYGETKPYDAAAKGAVSEKPTCELTPSLRQKTVCKSREEFDAFVAGYMEE